MVNLSLDSFQQMFSPNIRAILNWEILQNENVMVDTLVITEQQDLASMFTVWHVDSDGEFADWDNPQAHPLTIGKSLASEARWSVARKDNVEQFQKHYAASSECVNLLLPVYSVGERFVLLDSTHRAVAVIRGNLPFTAMLVSLKGPVSEQVLSDLRWHVNNP